MGLKDWKRISLPCKCRCCSIVVEDYQDGEVGITFESSYLEKQNGRFKRAWNALTNKETIYAEVIISKKEAINFFKKGLELLEGNKMSFYEIERKKDDGEELKLFGKE